MAQYRKPNTTTKHRHKAADGHLKNSPAPHDPHVRGAPPGRLKTEPSGDNYPVHFGPRADRVGEDNKRLTNITNERARPHPHSLARRFTKFITNIRGQVKIPRNLLSSDRPTAGQQADAERCIDVGQIPED